MHMYRSSKGGFLLATRVAAHQLLPSRTSRSSVRECAHICMCARVYVCLCVCEYMYACACMYRSACKYESTRVLIRALLYINTDRYTYAHACMHAYIYVHTCTHVGLGGKHDPNASMMFLAADSFLSKKIPTPNPSLPPSGRNSRAGTCVCIHMQVYVYICKL